MAYRVHTPLHTKNQVRNQSFLETKPFPPPPPYIGITQRPRKPFSTKRHYERLGEAPYYYFHIFKICTNLHLDSLNLHKKRFFECKKRFRGTK
jgi:hypothetical protein